MRCFTFRDANLIVGLEVINDDRFGPIVYLGSRGKDRRFEKITMFRSNPPDITDGYVLEAHPLKLQNHYMSLAKPNNLEDTRILLRVRTYDSGGSSDGYWSVEFGNVRRLVAANSTPHQNRDIKWFDDLISMTPDSAIKVVTSQGESFAIYYPAKDSGSNLPIHYDLEDWRENHPEPYSEADIDDEYATDEIDDTLSISS